MEEKSKNRSEAGENNPFEGKEQTAEQLGRPYIETVATNKHVSNADNRYLESLAPESVPSFDEVNGPDAKEVPEFNATRHELLELVRYWAFISLDMADFFLTGSPETTLRSFANRRISRIANLLGEGEVNKVI